MSQALSVFVDYVSTTIEYVAHFLLLPLPGNSNLYGDDSGSSGEVQQYSNTSSCNTVTPADS